MTGKHIMFWRLHRLLQDLTSSERTCYYHIIRKYAKLLEPGSYWLFREESRWVWKKSGFREWLRISIRQPKGIILRLMFFKKHCKIDADGNILGSILIITRAKTSVKIVDTDAQTIMSFYSDRSELDRVRAFCDEFIPYFGESTVLNIDYTNLIVTERFIRNLDGWWKIPKLFTECVKWLMTSYTEYVIKEKPVACITVSDLIDRAKTMIECSINEKVVEDDLFEIIQRAQIQLEPWLSLEIPLIKVHGDLHLNNILFDLERFWLIDCELYDDDVFCFDVLWWIIWCAIVLNDYSYINKYIEGVYDRWFDCFFKAMNFAYDDISKRRYIIIIIIGLYKHVVFIVNNRKKLTALLDYLENL